MGPIINCITKRSIFKPEGQAAREILLSNNDLSELIVSVFASGSGYWIRVSRNLISVNSFDQ